MKFSTGKTARAIRRREIISQLLVLIEKLQPADRSLASQHVLELLEISTIDANQLTRPRRKL